MNPARGDFRIGGRRRWPDQVGPLASPRERSMPAGRIGMGDARGIIRLEASSVSTHEIARRLGMARSTVRETLRRAQTAGLFWPLPEAMNDGALEAALYASRRSKRGHRRIEEPDWASVHRELKRKHVTLLILWDKYIAANPGGYSYSRFCELYRAFETTVSVTMRQTFAAGERLFVDYAGDGVPVVIDRLTGEIRMAQIFVAVLGASSFTFAKATWTQALPDWIDAHVRAFEAIGAFPNSSCRTMRRPPSSGPASTTLRSTAPTPRWPPIMGPPSCRRGRGSPATRRRSSRPS